MGIDDRGSKPDIPAGPWPCVWARRRVVDGFSPFPLCSKENLHTLPSHTKQGGVTARRDRVWPPAQAVLGHVHYSTETFRDPAFLSNKQNLVWWPGPLDRSAGRAGRSRFLRRNELDLGNILLCFILPLPPDLPSRQSQQARQQRTLCGRLKLFCNRGEGMHPSVACVDTLTQSRQ
ncbi:hypothetical protein VTK26DRAFT_5080 [Humicola hyalothermophila]